MGTRTAAGEEKEQRERRGAWLAFAMAMFAISAALSAVVGIAALTTSGIFEDDELVFGSLSIAVLNVVVIYSLMMYDQGQLRLTARRPCRVGGDGR